MFLVVCRMKYFETETERDWDVARKSGLARGSVFHEATSRTQALENWHRNWRGDDSRLAGGKEKFGTHFCMILVALFLSWC